MEAHLSTRPAPSVALRQGGSTLLPMPTASTPQHHVLRTLIERLAVAAALPEATVAGMLRPPPKPEMGDYALPCFELAKQRGKTPPQLAAELAGSLSGDEAILRVAERVEAAGPFLNFRVRPGVLVAAILEAVRAGGSEYGSSDEGRGQTIVLDYSGPNFAKPFHLEEVLARIRALLRRSAGHAKSELNCGAVRLDTRTGRVTVDGNPVKLTSHEYRLLSYLMHHAGRVVSRSELVEHLYDQDFDRDSNTIEVFVGRIRKKLGVDIIQTVRGLGYMLTPPGNAS